MGKPEGDDSPPELHHVPTVSAHDRESFDKQNAQIREIQGNAHYYETVTAAPLNAWSKTSIQLYFILLVAALNATASGFDGVSLDTIYLTDPCSPLLTRCAF